MYIYIYVYVYIYIYIYVDMNISARIDTWITRFVVMISSSDYLAMMKYEIANSQLRLPS